MLPTVPRSSPVQPDLLPIHSDWARLTMTPQNYMLCAACYLQSGLAKSTLIDTVHHTKGHINLRGYWLSETIEESDYENASKNYSHSVRYNFFLPFWHVLHPSHVHPSLNPCAAVLFLTSLFFLFYCHSMFHTANCYIGGECSKHIKYTQQLFFLRKVGDLRENI